MSVIDADSGAVVPDNATQPFPDPGETALDHAAQSAGRVLRQYRNSPNLQGLIAGLSALAQRIENCLIQIAALDAVATTNPSSTVDVNLDVTGDLVGQSRVLSDGTVLTNGQYVAAIGLRIARNHSIASSPQFVAAVTAALAIIYGGSPPTFRYYDLGGMAAGMEFGTGAVPDSASVALISDGGIAPVAEGVGIGREWYDPAEWFGFDEDTRSGSKGFGLESDPTAGGRLAMLF
jgi:hypothetical protein